MDFEKVIGLEVHCELKTNTKMFSAAGVTFGKDANTMVNEVDIAMLGTLPVVNKKAVEFAIRVCHALHMEIDELLCFDRKNYFYSDLPKGFQITQNRRPLGRNGYLEIEINHEKIKIDIEQLHLEEDTAKQLHYDDYSLIDYNRAGIPLIEIVTSPHIHSGAQAAAYLEKLRQILLYTDVSDAKLEEGSMRCDVNISIRPVGVEQLGTRTEIKNLNSISNVEKAIEVEAKRQEEILLSKKSIVQETRRFDELTQKTILMRDKGDYIDYRYYPEPNILPIRLSPQWILDIKKQLPIMPDDREEIYIKKHGLLKQDAINLVKRKNLSDFYEETIQLCQEYRKVCHWILGDVQAYLNKNNLTLEQTSITPLYLSQLISYVDDGVVSSKQAKVIFELMMEEHKSPEEIIEEKAMKQISDEKILTEIIQDILNNNNQSILDYANGKNKAVGYLVGLVMKKTNGQANPIITNQILLQLLKERTQ